MHATNGALDFQVQSKIWFGAITLYYLFSICILVCRIFGSASHSRPRENSGESICVYFCQYPSDLLMYTQLLRICCVSMTCWMCL